MIFTVGWAPVAAVPEGPLGVGASPRLAAFVRAFVLTTAWARLSREERGWEGRVYFNKVTANASNKGARFVCRTVEERIAGEADEIGRVGREREASMAEGEIGWVEDVGVER